MAVAIGMPVYAGSATAPRPVSAPPLRVIAEILREQLDVKGSVPQVVEAAAELLGLQLDAASNLMARARQCHEALNGDGSWQRRSRPQTATRAVPASEVAEGTPLEDEAPHPMLKCRGVEFGFQYYNFFGEWQVSDSGPGRMF